jgi:molybdopterin molybdotransferase
VIDVATAHELIAKHIRRNRIVESSLMDGLGLVLAQVVKSKAPSPRFDASSVDGYGVSFKDFTSSASRVSLPISRIIQAGDTTNQRMRPGSAVRIFTGAKVPSGVDAIVMQEDVVLEAGIAHFSNAPRTGANIRRQGDEFARGVIIFEKGVLITPAVLSTLATLGFASIKVYASATATIVCTGNELRAPGEKLKLGEIYDANSFALRGALKVLGIEQVKVRHVKDTINSVTSALEKSLAESEFVIVTGGVSVGDHDHVREALDSLRVQEIFWRVKLKPGKPLYFGKRGACYVFGLPGNPVSVLVTFQLFVREALMRSMGVDRADRSRMATLGSSLHKRPGRTEYVRGQVSVIPNQPDLVTPIKERESHMTSGMSWADCLIEFPEQAETLSAGDQVRVIPIEWSVFE